MRLTADLIHSSLSYINPLNERELDLRGHKIPVVENLGVARDQDALDLTDNVLTHLSNFPLSPRLRTLLLARNRITTIQPTLHRSLPNLTTLVLSHNRIAELADLDALAGFGRLTHLSLLENPVTTKENYRLWVLSRCPHVRFLDFQKVRQEERSRAEELFGTMDEPTELADTISLKRTHPQLADSTTGGTSGGRVKLTAAERRRVEAMIRNAGSLAEIARLEKELAEGRIPGGVGGVDEMDV